MFLFIIHETYRFIHLSVIYRRRKAGKLGIGSACIGGGQGIAVMIEHL